MNHPKNIEKYNWTIKELWRDIVNLDYDSLVELFDVLTSEFAKDSVYDLELKHPQVSEKLTNISNWLKNILENDAKPLADLCRWYNQRWEK
jgi:hypothetical protein